MSNHPIQTLAQQGSHVAGKVQPSALIVGGGPAGLSAAEVLAAGGVWVTVVDAMPSFGRKFLMAGKSGLNLTFDTDLQGLSNAYHEGIEHLQPALAAFDAEAVQTWACDLGQSLFTGSTRRVFPQVMKASPLLRAWLARLEALGVERRTRWRWTGWDADGQHFETPTGHHVIQADVVILALGGGSWRRLGSDGAWMDVFRAQSVPCADFGPSNVGLAVDWSQHMTPVFGQPLKDVAFSVGEMRTRGEAVISQTGLEGGGIYTLSPALRRGAPLKIDLMPSRGEDWIAGKLAQARKKDSVSNMLRKALGLSPTKIALFQEMCRPAPKDPKALAIALKAVTIPEPRLGALDEAISTSGGVAWEALSKDFMLTEAPGIFCAGEMLDWDAPTGGYLLTACFATGRWAGLGALRWLSQRDDVSPLLSLSPP